MRKRVWWELVFLDIRTAQKGGMGSSFVPASWSTALPSERSDTDMDNSNGANSSLATQPSSEMLLLSHSVRKKLNSRLIFNKQDNVQLLTLCSLNQSMNLRQK